MNVRFFTSITGNYWDTKSRVLVSELLNQFMHDHCGLIHAGFVHFLFLLIVAFNISKALFRAFSTSPDPVTPAARECPPPVPLT